VKELSVKGLLVGSRIDGDLGQEMAWYLID
jgi:hypothetical protein